MNTRRLSFPRFIPRRCPELDTERVFTQDFFNDRKKIMERANRRKWLKRGIAKTTTSHSQQQRGFDHIPGDLPLLQFKRVPSVSGRGAGRDLQEARGSNQDLVTFPKFTVIKR